MSFIKLVAQLEEKEKLWKKETENHFENQRRKYNEIFEKITHVKGESEKCMDDITKSLDKLVANKHTIEKALEQSANHDGLPIPQEQHENAIDLINKITNFMNNTEQISSSNVVLPDQIQKDVANFVESVENELTDCKTEFIQVKALKHNSEVLKNLILNSTENKEFDNYLHPISENE